MNNYSIGDILTTKKSHPCKNNTWTVIFVGADIKIKCNKCGRIVLLDRITLDKAVKKIDKS